MTPTLKTDRLTLRPRAMTDAERVALLLDDHDVSGMLFPVPHPYTLADAREWLSGAFDDPRDMDFVLDRGEGFMGVVGFGWVEADARRLGFWLGRPYWGQGYAMEAVRAVVDWGFRERGIARIDSAAYLDNPGSRRIHARLGFTEGAVAPEFSVARGASADAVSLRLTREDWNPDR